MGDTQILYIIFAVTTLVLVLWIVRLEVRIRKLMLGKNGRSLEDTVIFIKNEVELLGKARKEIEQALSYLHARIKKTVSRVETMRFNPFRGDGSGGNQSFVMALSDEEGTGVVLSGLYAREKMSVYAKPLKNFASEIELMDEEKEVLQKIKK